MAISALRRNTIFLAGSVLAGLVLALAVTRLWPDLVRPPPPVAVDFTPPAPQSEAAARPVPTTTREVAAAAAPAASAADNLLAHATNGSFSAAVRVSAPAVVSVYTRRTIAERVPAIEQLLGGPTQPRYRIQDGLGSGVIVDAQGHIVTNQHVITDSDQIAVKLADGRIANARVVGRDPDTDLAVLKIDLPRLPVMTLGRSDRVAVGDVVLAIGNPLDLSQTVTHGIVSATGRAQLGVATYESFIQTDAAINVGNSGGALVNTRGELIGINTAVLGKNIGAEGIGVAIPVDLVRGVMDEILQHGRVIRGWVGIRAQDIPQEYAAQLGLAHGGVVVIARYCNSPALAAGLQRGDLIETVNGQTVLAVQDTLARIASRKPGGTITVTGLRRTEKFSMVLPVVEPPPSNGKDCLQ